MSSLQQVVRRELQAYMQAPGWCLAFSGGLDSSVLLHVLAGLCRESVCPPLRAVHVHHGLQAAADAWPEHCRQQCEQLGVPFQAVYVRVEQAASVEQAARDARYAAFASRLGPGEVLLLAQHQDDQAETLLLRLLRGSGVAGLQGMPRSRALGAGHILRPLLQVSRRQLEEYARQHGLSWIEDPSNQSVIHDRNFLRNQVMPVLRQRWPALDSLLQRTAGHMQQAQGLLDELAGLDLQQAARSSQPGWLPLECLDLDVIRSLSVPRQTNLIRFWLRGKTRLPDTVHWAGWHSLLQAGSAAQPLWRLQDGALVRHGARLYWLTEHWLHAPPPVELQLDADGDYPLPGNGLLQVAGLHGAQWRVGYRQGGEQLELPGRGRRDLKRLLQEQQVPVFLRDRLPLLFFGDRLVAVAGLPGLSAAGIRVPELCWIVPA